MSAEELQSPRVAIGISFGNSYSSIASTIGADAKVIANEEGDRQIPTAISYIEGEEYHGAQAKGQLVRNSKNTVVGFRDYVGKDFSNIDPTPSHNSAHPFESNGSIAFTVVDTEAEAPSTVTVSEITTRHLKRLRDSASDYLGKTVNAAVIAAPTDFSEAQKKALTESAKNAGLEVLQYISEPVAALVAHDSRADDKPKDRIVVVADLGGIRSDVAVISIKGGMYSTLATAHDYAVGGTKLDEALIDYIAKEFIKKHKVDPRENERGLSKMKLEAEATKKALSIGNTAAFNVESLVDGIDYSISINRTRFEMLGAKVFARFSQLINDAINKAGLDVLDVDEILLSGGSAHVPRIAANLSSTFPETTTVVAPSTDPAAINPSELTPRGAAQQASLIEGFDTEDIDQSTHAAVTVTPHLQHSIGIELLDGTFLPIIPAETPLPVRRTMAFTSANDGDILLRVSEGIREIKVSQPEPKSRAEQKEAVDDDEDEDDDDDEEVEEIREKIWKAGNSLGELALKDVKKGAKITAQIQVGADLEVTFSAMQAGKPGVKGSIPATGGINGGAH